MSSLGNLFSSKPDFDFLRYERHVTSCDECIPAHRAHQAWKGSGDRPSYCSEGERLWQAYLFPSLVVSAEGVAALTTTITTTVAESVVHGEEDSRQVPGMPEKLAVLLPTCRYCDALADEGYGSCEKCRAKKLAFYHVYWDARRAAGLCGKCGLPSVPGGKLCPNCRARFVEKYQQLRDGDSCARCRGPKEEIGRPYCVACRAIEAERKREARRKATLAGVCYVCHKTSVRSGRRLCPKCSKDTIERRQKWRERSEDQIGSKAA